MGAYCVPNNAEIMTLADANFIKNIFINANKNLATFFFFFFFFFFFLRRSWYLYQNKTEFWDYKYIFIFVIL